jgi:hypothetical protein
MATTPIQDITKLNANLNAHCRENRFEIFKNMELSLEKDLQRSGIMLYTDIKHKLPLLAAETNDIIQPADSDNFTPLNPFMDLSNREITVKGIKVDLLLQPAKLYETYLQHMKQNARRDNAYKGEPFHKWLINKIPVKASANMRKTMWDGDVASANTTLKCFDGFKKKFRADVVANRIPVVNVTSYLGGGWTDANFWKGLNYIKDSVSDVQFEENSGGKIFVPIQLWKWILAASESTIGRTMQWDTIPGDNGKVAQKILMMPGTNIEVVAQSAFTYNATTGFMQTAFVENDQLIFGTGDYSQMSEINAQEFERTIKLLMDWSAGVEYQYASLVGRNQIVCDNF